MAEAIAGIRWDLTASTAQFEAALKRATGSLKQFEKAGEVVGGLVASALTRLGALAAAYLTVSQAVGQFNRSIEDVSAMGRLAQQTGISVERLSELRFAASSVGVTFEVLQQAVRGFAQRMQEGLANPTSNVTLALNALGVAARNTDGTLRNFDQMLPDLADSFSRFRDGATKAQLASALFGEEAGPRLVALLNKGADGIAEFSREARRLGLTMTGDQVRIVEEYRLAQLRLSESFSAVSRELTVAFAPALSRAADAIAHALRQIRGPEASDFERYRELAGGIEILRESLQRALEAQEQLRMGGEARPPLRWLFSSQPSLAQLAAEIANLQADITARLLEQERIAARMWRPTVHMELPPGPDLAAIREGIRQAQGQLQLFLANLSTVPAQATFMSDVYAEAWRRMEATMRQANETEGAIQLARINLLRQEESERLRVLGASVTMEETLSRRLNELAKARELNLITETQLLRARAQAQAQYASSVAGGVATAMQALASAWPKQKALAIAAAVANTAQAVTRTWAEWGWPLGVPFAAAQLAAGIAQINAIRSANPGGASNPPAAGGGAPVEPSTGANPQPQHALTIDLHGDSFTREQVRVLFERMNEFTQDGGVLITTVQH